MSSPHPRPLQLFTAMSAACAGVIGLAVLWPEGAQSQETNFAGSIQTNYLWVATDDNARAQAFDGFTNELSLKAAVDLDDHISANVKLCYGCHGVEVDMAFIDLRVVDALNFRVGRFNPSFGDFPLRHDPANHRTSDKPLPYDMGRMLRMREWNMGVLPSPYVDQGLEVNGTHWFGDVVQLDYAAYGVSGLRSGAEDVDLDWMMSRSVYYIDQNSEPAVGGRLAVTLDMSAFAVMTLGSSGMWGRSDPDRKRSYAIVGFDAYLRLADFELRAEYLIRRMQMAMDDPDERFRYGPDDEDEYDDYFLKDGFYVEATAPVPRLERLELVGRFDGLRRTGNVLINSPLRYRSAVLRYTAGVNIVFDASVRLKLSAELYDFTDFDDEVVANAGVVAAF
jgi:hypothetical protein